MFILNALKIKYMYLKCLINHQPKKNKDYRSLLERKQDFLSASSSKRLKRLKKYYKSHPAYKNRWRYILFVRHLCDKKIKSKWLNLLRWIFVDLLRGRKDRTWGIYQFVALPGEGKTLSMVAHMERFIEKMEKKKLPYVIATNFHYTKQHYQIEHWMDIIKIAKDCYSKKINCLVAMDEIHVTFEASDWKNFPSEMLALLSFNRKFGLQFLCSSQIYERIPKKIRDIANYTVICANVLHFDRYFKNYYFEKNSYEQQFEGKPAKARFTREFVAGDDLYVLYDTLEQVEKMQADAEKEKDMKKQAFNILFGNSEPCEGMA